MGSKIFCYLVLQRKYMYNYTHVHMYTYTHVQLYILGFHEMMCSKANQDEPFSNHVSIMFYFYFYPFSEEKPC